jgi:hypothetical protein
MSNPQQLYGRPQRIFISVDEASGKSTLSFLPAEVSPPYQIEDDRQGERALKEAREVAARHPGCTVEGPHFHTPKPGAKRMRRRPERPGG